MPDKPINAEAFMELGDILQVDTLEPITVLRAIPHNGFFDRYLNKVRRDGHDETLASHSYHHDNGFIKLVLGSCANGRYKLRAHFWPKEGTNYGSNVHNHRFGFTSRVMHGVLEHTVYAIAEGGREYHHFEYSPQASASKYILRHLGPAFLREVSRQQFAAGDYYSFPSDGLHTSDPKFNEPVVTLFVEDRLETTRSCDVFSTRYPPQDVQIDAPSMNAIQWSDALNLILRFAQTT